MNSLYSFLKVMTCLKGDRRFNLSNEPSECWRKSREVSTNKFTAFGNFFLERPKYVDSAITTFAEQVLVVVTVANTNFHQQICSNADSRLLMEFGDAYGTKFSDRLRIQRRRGQIGQSEIRSFDDDDKDWPRTPREKRK